MWFWWFRLRSTTSMINSFEKCSGGCYIIKTYIILIVFKQLIRISPSLAQQKQTYKDSIQECCVRQCYCYLMILHAPNLRQWNRLITAMMSGCYFWIKMIVLSLHTTTTTQLDDLILNSIYGLTIFLWRKCCCNFPRITKTNGLSDVLGGREMVRPKKVFCLGQRF